MIFWAYCANNEPYECPDGPARHIIKVINNGKELIFVKAGSKKIKSDYKSDYDAFLAECDDADPEKMMKEFVEKKENGEVEEDEYRRPKNQPHNLHRVDEGDEEAGGEAEDESEDEFELNESMVRFCDRLIIG